MFLRYECPHRNTTPLKTEFQSLEHAARLLPGPCTGKPEMTSQLDAAYSEIARELGAQVIPVGLAFATVTDERPDIILRIADARHPTLAGTYLATCTFFAALFNQSPEGLEYSAGLDHVASCQKCTGWLAGKHFPTMRDRHLYIRHKLEMAFRKPSKTDWRKKEINELGPNLRSVVAGSERKFRKLEARMAYAKAQAQSVE